MAQFYKIINSNLASSSPLSDSCPIDIRAFRYFCMCKFRRGYCF
ncbi:hypothetical protein THF1A12_330006 [Vibrio jasicida]|uniref:Uncharacterized protein n=1 Tax=Vibrio jasicida TaxID=766224 RepID=A0AAU9QPQ7_9VIBR|nr:hypothetical protein THF1A12_330006 [Vibrio jasicida]